MLLPAWRGNYKSSAFIVVVKLPPSPGTVALRNFAPAIASVEFGTHLARIYQTAGRGATAWGRFRSYGPLGSRFDHHLTDSQGRPQEQERAILYCAVHMETCVAETFQVTRRIDRVLDAPWLAVFALERSINLLDLTGAFTTRIGASTALGSGSRKRARDWSRCFHAAYPNIDGLLYCSSMNGHAPAIALYERARTAIPSAPLFNRPLADDVLLDILKHCADHLGYGIG